MCEVSNVTGPVYIRAVRYIECLSLRVVVNRLHSHYVPIAKYYTHNMLNVKAYNRQERHISSTKLGTLLLFP